MILQEKKTVIINMLLLVLPSMSRCRYFIPNLSIHLLHLFVFVVSTWCFFYRHCAKLCKEKVLMNLNIILGDPWR